MANQGRGKSSYRRFTKQANILKRQFTKELDNDTGYTYEQIEYEFALLRERYSEELTSEQLDYFLWYDRATEFLLTILSDLSEHPNILLENKPGDTGHDKTDEDSTGEEENTNDDNYEIPGLPYPLISEQQCRDNGGRPRQQILLSIDEAQDYLEPIPPGLINGLIPVYDNNGLIIGVKACISDNS